MIYDGANRPSPVLTQPVTVLCDSAAAGTQTPNTHTANIQTYGNPSNSMQDAAFPAPVFTALGSQHNIMIKTKAQPACKQATATQIYWNPRAVSLPPVAF